MKSTFSVVISMFLAANIGNIDITEGKTYKHIVFVHGIFAGPSEVTTMKSWIGEVHPGTNITAIDMFDRLWSLVPLWRQIKALKLEIQQVIKNSPQGTIFICFSQGGLVCRGLLSVLDHNAETFISLSSPLMGQYGDTDYLSKFFPKYIKESLYRLFYTKKMQNHLSIANYWNDPHHQNLYLKFSNFLAVINNQSYNPHSIEYKRNFLKLKHLVMVGGPDDGVITPWQSSHMDCYDAHDRVVNMKDQQYYKNDWFGLKTLDERKAIHIFTIPGVNHTHWYRTRIVFNKAVLPFLT